MGRFAAMLQETRGRLLRDLRDLAAVDLDRLPAGSPNTVGTLLYHVAAIELDWVYADLLEREFPPEIEAWFPWDVREDSGQLTPVVEPLERHLARLAWVRERTLEALRGLDDAELDRLRGTDPIDGAWILHHLMQHEGEHRGQIGEIRATLAAG